MVFGWDDALMIGGSLISGLGGKSKGEASSAVQGGFDALPDAVKTAYLNTYLPDVLKQYNAPREPIPLVRANEPTTPFDSVELYNLQQFSDAVGGYFSPMGQSLQQTYNPQPAAAAPANPQAGNLAMAREWAQALTPYGGAQGLSQQSINQIRSRVGSMDEAGLAQLGALLAERGGVYKNLGLGFNDFYSARTGQSLV